MKKSIFTHTDNGERYEPYQPYEPIQLGYPEQR